MKNLDLATYGVDEMNEVQMQGVDGGGTAGPGASYWTEHKSFMDVLDYCIGFFAGFWVFKYKINCYGKKYNCNSQFR